jgi:hypothetical protein
MDPGFRGEVADFYHKYRRVYPPAIITAMADQRESISHPIRARSTLMRVPQDVVGGNGRDFAVGWNGRSVFFVLGLRAGRRPG